MKNDPRLQTAVPPLKRGAKKTIKRFSPQFNATNSNLAAWGYCDSDWTKDSEPLPDSATIELMASWADKIERQGNITEKKLKDVLYQIPFARDTVRDLKGQCDQHQLELNGLNGLVASAQNRHNEATQTLYRSIIHRKKKKQESNKRAQETAPLAVTADSIPDKTKKSSQPLSLGVAFLIKTQAQKKTTLAKLMKENTAPDIEQALAKTEFLLESAEKKLQGLYASKDRHTERLGQQTIALYELKQYIRGTEESEAIKRQGCESAAGPSIHFK
jgi:hypothetical protein